MASPTSLRVLFAMAFASSISSVSSTSSHAGLSYPTGKHGACSFTNEPAWRYQLMSHIEQVTYDLSLDLRELFSNNSFSGQLSIFFKSTAKFTFLTLNARTDLIQISNAALRRLSDQKNVQLTMKELIMSEDLITAKVDEIGIIGEFELQLDYTAQLPQKGNLPCGLIVSKRDQVAITFFEPSRARWVFPSFDHPSIKAAFRLNIKHNPEETALSNTKQQVSIPHDAPAVFEQTTSLPTYSFAFALVRKHKVFSNENTKTQNQIPVRVFCPAGESSLLNKAEQLATKAAGYFEDIQKFMGFRLKLSKLDFVVAEFPMGAMENNGLVQMSRYGMRSSKKNAVHEIIHHWVGNLFTLKRWTDLCLQEGLTSYLTEQLSEQFNIGSGLDRRIRYVEGQALNHEYDRIPLTDAKSLSNWYLKGFLVFQLLNDTFSTPGHDFMRAFTQTLIEKYAYGNAGMKEWAAIAGPVAGKLLTTFMTEVGVVQVDVTIVKRFWLKFRQGRFLAKYKGDIVREQELHQAEPIPIDMRCKVVCDGTTVAEISTQFATEEKQIYTAAGLLFLNKKCELKINDHWKSDFLIKFKINI